MSSVIVKLPSRIAEQLSKIEKEPVFNNKFDTLLLFLQELFREDSAVVA
jgi:hypothetical protein